MKLDKRIIEGKKYLDCFDTDTATEFVGEKCYFGEDVTDFEDISKLTCTMLYSVDNSSAPYDYYKDGILHSTGFILPAEWVKKPKKKYRPYSLSEWIEQHEIGDVIHYRSKSDGTELLHMYLGTRHRPESVKITLGDASYSLERLFEDYEIEVNSEWKPFGVEAGEE